jgi:hypothetical protein
MIGAPSVAALRRRGLGNDLLHRGDRQADQRRDLLLERRPATVRVALPKRCAMKRSIVIATVLLAGCVSGPEILPRGEVVPRGGDKYSITVRSRMIGPNVPDETRNEALTRAKAFCTGLNKRWVGEFFDNQLAPKTYTSRLDFRCE